MRARSWKEQCRERQREASKPFLKVGKLGFLGAGVRKPGPKKENVGSFNPEMADEVPEKVL